LTEHRLESEMQLL